MKIYKFKRNDMQPVLAMSPSGTYKYWDMMADAALSADLSIKSGEIRQYCDGRMRPTGRFMDYEFIAVTDIKLENDTVIFNDEFVFRRCRIGDADLIIRRITDLRREISPEFEHLYFKREV